MKTAHTPGPWTVNEIDATGEPSKYYIFIEPNVAVIERKVDGQNECDFPDARLMAAAPDLLAALQGVLRVANRSTDEFDAAWIAIAKATGETA